VRTIREYQTWRLLHPPARRGRVGWYDDSHVERLRTIGRLQNRGYSIAGIRDLLDAWSSGAELRDILGVDRQAQPETMDETPIVLSDAALRELLPAARDLESFTAALLDCGAVSQVGDRLIARSPALLLIFGDATRAGLGEGEALRVVRSIVDAASEVAAEVAGAIAVVADRADALELEPLLRRGRVLLGRAMASHLVDQIGRRLLDSADSDGSVMEAVEHLRIGSLDLATRDRTM
jgi:DNA-binding transcriptional MerR regulator